MGSIRRSIYTGGRRSSPEVQVEKIRVLLANHPLMLPDDIRHLVEEQEDMEIVGDCRGPMKILQEAGRTKADAVILAHEGMQEPGLCSQLLAVYPDLTILGLTPDMTTGFVRQLCSRRHALAEIKKQDVIQRLRTAVRDPCSERDG
jgi:DNA-binding NarL/FixJ family response regulator